MTRLTALERERAAIIAEIEILQSAPSEQTAAIKVNPSEKAGDLVDRNSTIENKIALFRRKAHPCLRSVMLNIRSSMHL
jgi:hypothetical protein